MKYQSLSEYVTKTYGHKLYKVSIDGGFTCPNRDGTIGTGGCIFCLDGSGAFAQNRKESITTQIENGKKLIEAKAGKNAKYIAYFQSFTGTYGPIDDLRSKYMEAVLNPDTEVISIATRPDCVNPEVLNLLNEIKQIKPVWVELGLQTIHETTAEVIRRGYSLDVYKEAVEALNNLGIKVITHMIIGLPGESSDMIVETARYIGQSGSWGIKFQLLHILEGTELASMYDRGEFNALTLEEYADILVECLRVIPDSMVVHRITGDGDKKHLIAPLWSGNKKYVLNYLNKRILEANK